MEQKIIWMPLLVFGILNSLFFSCSIIEYKQLQQFVYINNSDYFILIDRHFNDLRKKYSILKNDSLVQEIDLGFGSTENLIIYSDSVKVVSDNSKVLKFTLTSNINRNLLKGDNYESYRKNDILITKYIFSNTDYDSAEDCNGNCN